MNIRTLIAVVSIVIVGILPVSAQSRAQNECADNALAELERIIWGSNDETYIEQMQAKYEVIIANCFINTPPPSSRQTPTPAPTAPPGSGQTHTNPVPFGSEYVFLSALEASIGLTIIPTDFEIIDPPGSGKEWLPVRVSVRCIGYPDERCEIFSYDFRAAGLQGITYYAGLTPHVQQDESIELFGGEQAEMDIVFEVYRRDSDFVISTGYPEVYFAIE